MPQSIIQPKFVISLNRLWFTPLWLKWHHPRDFFFFYFIHLAFISPRTVGWRVTHGYLWCAPDSAMLTALHSDRTVKRHFIAKIMCWLGSPAAAVSQRCPILRHQGWAYAGFNSSSNDRRWSEGTCCLLWFDTCEFRHMLRQQGFWWHTNHKMCNLIA